jgi:hypothetical protein
MSRHIVIHVLRAEFWCEYQIFVKLEVWFARKVLAGRRLSALPSKPEQLIHPISYLNKKYIELNTAVLLLPDSVR